MESRKVKRIATIGFFDGVHKGHQYLFEQLDLFGAERGLQPLIITFSEHPRAVLQSDYVPQLLTTTSERRALLSTYGEVEMLPFASIQALTAAEFMQRLAAQYEVAVLLMGYDHRFGSDRLKHPQDYRRIGEQYGINVLTMNEFMEGEWHVSSTEIRSALKSGNIAVANELLGRPYALQGKVIHGKGLGRQLGFPTANIMAEQYKLLPQSGVYEARVNTPTMDDAPAFVNIDVNGLIEAHIPSFKGDLYDQTLEIRFLRFIREERRFASIAALREQIKADVDSIRRRV
jgi:riboflavin kinase/FMN adenylyltransferase